MSEATNYTFDNEAMRKLRKSARLSFARLAERSGVPLSTVASLEYGRRTHPRMSTVRAIARALGVPAESLMLASREPAVPRVGPVTITDDGLVLLADYEKLSDEGKAALRVCLNNLKRTVVVGMKPSALRGRPAAHQEGSRA